jgi:hypothetical protein
VIYVDIVLPFSQWCGPGYFKVGSLCLLMTTWPASENHMVHWKVASQKCAQHGARPAILKTPELLRETQGILQTHAANVPTFVVGLRNVSPLLPLW